MNQPLRHALRVAIALFLILLALPGMAARKKPIRVVIWDERQPAQKTVYPNFLGNYLAEYLTKVGAAKPGREPEFVVMSVGLDDPDQGLPKEVLDNCDVLIWWGHQRHADVKDELVKDIVERIKKGQISLFSLHSAHWSKPFTGAMDARAIQDALKSLPARRRASATVITIPGDRRLMDRNERLTPYFTLKSDEGKKAVLEVKLPSCVFPAVRADGKPGHITTVMPNHPIAKGVPATFDIPQTEMYDEPFHVPTPDAVIFEEKWDGGEHFRSGDVWSVGKGKVFYFRPGHETFPVFKQPETLRIVENAVRWLGTHPK
jgi:trehalose utilization protein